MRFAVLGPLEVSVDAGPLSLGGRKQRTLLAVLLLHANEVASRDQLVDALWGERPPPSAGDSLDAYLYRLRKLLSHDRLLRQAGGYLLRVEPGELDADRFEQLAAQRTPATMTPPSACLARRSRCGADRRGATCSTTQRSAPRPKDSTSCG